MAVLHQILLMGNAAAPPDPTEIQRSLRSKCAIAHDFDGNLSQDGRTGLSLSGTAAYTTGPDGGANGALADSGSDVRFLNTDPSGISLVYPTQPWAFEAFVRLRDLGNNYYLWQASETNAQRFGVLHNTGAADSLDVEIGTQTIMDSSLTQDVWEHVVVSSDGTDIKIYRDTTNTVTETITYADAMPINRWAIGTSISSTPARLGYDIAFMRYYHDQLTQDEVDYLYNAGDGRPASDFMTVAYGTDPDTYAGTLGLSGFWKLNETSGTNAPDTAGGVGAGTLTSGAAYSTAVDPPAGFSAADTVVAMDGSNDFIDLPSLDYTSGSLSHAFGVWVRATSLNASGLITWAMGSDVSSAANVRYFFSSSAGAIEAGMYSSGGANVVSANSVTAKFATGGWRFTGGLYDATAGVNLAIYNGYVVGAARSGTSMNAALLDENYLGKYTSAGYELNGYMSRAYLRKAATLTLPQIAKLYDLGNGSG